MTQTFYSWLKQAICLLITRPRVRDAIDRLLGPAAQRIPRLRRYRLWLLFQYAINGDHLSALAKAEELAALPDLDHDLLDILGSLYRLHSSASRSREFFLRAAECRAKLAVAEDLDQLCLRIFPARLFHNIGHTGTIDLYLKGVILGLITPKQPVILGGLDQFDNPVMAGYWQRYCAVIAEPKSVRYLAPVAALIEECMTTVRMADGSLLSGPELAHAVLPAWERSGRPPLLHLNDDHRTKGRDWLRRAGMPEGAWFCGLHVRAHPSPTTAVRNADVATYDLAIDEIVRRGGWVIRLGDHSMPPLRSRHSQIIDCPTMPDHQDWMDVFVWAEARFLVATGSGPGIMPMLFDKPTLLTNWGPMASLICNGRDLLLPKHYWLESEQRYLTMEERLSDHFGQLESHDSLAERGVSVRNNTAEEIRDAVVEMFERLEGTHRPTASRHAAQEHFRQLADKTRIYPGALAGCFIDAYVKTV